MSAMTLTAQTSGINSQVSTPRLTPLRMIERNRNTDKDDISRLENKIKALETDITVAKQLNETRRLDKLEQSLTNTSIPALNDNSLLEEDDNQAESVDGSSKRNDLLINKLLKSDGTNKKDQSNKNNDSMLQEDELAILADYKEKSTPA